jgi:hypothetical protein
LKTGKLEKTKMKKIAAAPALNVAFYRGGMELKMEVAVLADTTTHAGQEGVG